MVKNSRALKSALCVRWEGHGSTLCTKMYCKKALFSRLSWAGSQFWERAAAKKELLVWVPLNGLSCDCFCVCFLNGVFAFFLLPALVFCASRRVSERGVRPASALQPPVFLWPAPPPAPSLLLFLSCCTKSSINHTQSRSHSPGRPLSSRIHYTHTHSLLLRALFIYIFPSECTLARLYFVVFFNVRACNFVLCAVPQQSALHVFGAFFLSAPQFFASISRTIYLIKKSSWGEFYQPGT